MALHGQQQDAKLARHYYQSGEYEKAARLYKKLSDKYGYVDSYFNQYMESLMALESYDEAEESIKDMIKDQPDMAALYVAYGGLLERMAKMDEADQQYRLAIDNMKADRGTIINLGNAFVNRAKYDLALETYLKAIDLMGDESLFAQSIAEIYRRQNDAENMIKYFLKSRMAESKRISSVKNYFHRYLKDKSEYDMLRKALYQYTQTDPDNIFYPEMIEWVFIQNKDYKRALRQAKSLDLRLEEKGSRLFNIGRIASNDGDYDTAIKAYGAIIETKPATSSYFLEAQKEVLSCKRKKITTGEYTEQELLDLKQEYITFLDDNGRSSRTSLIIAKLAELEALYLNQLDTAIVTLNDLLSYPGLNNYVKANAKLDLADYYLMDGEVWDATLLYSQVDKEFREDHLGEKARFKNAKLSYYIGDFEWAQEQFGILKNATTRLIANDAIDLSVFIMDNANLDTTYAPIAFFAEAELLLFQNKRDEAFAKMDSIAVLFPDHTLADDVLYAKAERLRADQEIDEAATLYERIITDHADGIRADNALYALAEIYDEHMGDREKAKELYQKLFLEYSDSTLVVEARKNFRRLRGDDVQ